MQDDQKVRRLSWIRGLADGCGHGAGEGSGIQNKQNLLSSGQLPKMSELLRAAENREWEKLVVRRPPGSCLVTSSVYSASRRALKAG